MSALPAGVALVTVPLVLLGSLAGQVARPGLLAAALRAHRTVPRGLAVVVARLVSATEAVLLGAVIVGLVRWEPVLLRVAMASAAALLTLYALYSAYVTRTRPHGVPCGCAGIETPMTGWVAARAGILGLIALAGAAVGPPQELRPSEVFVCCAAGVAFTVISWILPESMSYEGGTAR
ncbi:MauE/DoxX family redox-associated membrane protein [Spirillospora sp. NPDC048911]|uniref:MauE/DoxX family redox-associated membrane protein n=1 Tax=Spirillospora sp. NPDC048911 TaxID=3364527 RepID=UPI00371AC6ED